MNKIKLALVQFDSKIKDVEYNLKKGLKFVKEAGEKKADIIVFPELFTTGYNVDIIKSDYFDLAETINGNTINTLKKEAMNNNINIVAPIALEKEIKGVIYNSAVVIDRLGNILGSYDKTHLWAGDKFYFKEGNSYPVFELDFGKIGIMICYDGGFPEVSRILALKGAELILCPSAFPIWDKYMWDIYFKSRALENVCFVAGINRVGKEEKLEMFGNNKLCNPRGEVLLDAIINKEDMQIVEIDLDLVKEHRKKIPYLKDRKIDSFSTYFKD
jgi:predicted amidohydrolase